jgi:flavin-binding protein dodecin
MPNGKVYRKTEIVGTSNESMEEAITTALERAQRTLRNVQWFEVTEQRGAIVDGQIEFQITLEIGFELEERT